ncbi:hypothetical protein ABC304_02175 [Microbacterium sp. 1P10UB]|uniref:hypothetical protein n=1 Tax=unclassified Microbacterium TaxID=2609290 RepID=UPI0039A117C3
MNGERQDHAGARRTNGDAQAGPWSQPAVALTVATPLVAADPVAPSAEVPTVSVLATTPVTRNASSSAALFISAAVVYTAAGTTATTGQVHLEFTSDGPFEPDFDEDDFAAAGWTRVPGRPRAVFFCGASMSDGQSRRVPRFRWRGAVAARGRLAADVRADNPDVATRGVSVDVR